MQKNSNDLSEFSSSYYEKADVYKLFSDAEDQEHFIWNALKDTFHDQSVLDLGCGNGRYLELIKPITSYCIGVDQSLPQIKQGNQDLSFVVSDGSMLPFADNTFDYTLSCWVWGTVLDENKRNLILSEAIRVTKSGGSIFLVENDVFSEFEYYRGRHLNTKTQDYNEWILAQNFVISHKLHTFISFDTVSTAQYVFKEIWKDRLFDLPYSNKIQNNVIIFELKID